MTIEWNKVTWYSKIVSVVLFVATFFLGFWLGTIKAQHVDIEMTTKNAQSVSLVKTSTSTLEISDITSNPAVYNGKTLFVHGKLYCNDVSPYFSVVDFLPLPNPNDDPLQYLEVYVVEGGRYAPLKCGDSRYQTLVSGEYSKENGLVLKGMFVERTSEKHNQFVNLYATLPSPGIGDREVYKYRSTDFFVLGE